MNMQGMAFIVRLTIRNQHEDHYHASSPDFPVQDVTLTRIGG
jgi:hypothetical protein